jgi:hypothetical protein
MAKRDINEIKSISISLSIHLASGQSSLDGSPVTQNSVVAKIYFFSQHLQRLLHIQ